MARRRTKHEVPEQLRDFRNFLFLVWRHLNLPDPTPIQYDIAYQLQHGPRRFVIEAFRGVGKSWITSAYVCWLLLMDPQRKVMVVSASKERADQFSKFTKQLIGEMKVLRHLQPRTGQRDSNISFDVGPALADHSPSVKSVGITGQMAGSRADIIVPDDVEVPSNSRTQTMRDQLSEAIKEFDAVLKPGGMVRYLGTPQSEMSIYNDLPERGYPIMIWPARYPSPKQMKRYTGQVAPIILDQLEGDPSLADACGGRGAPTDPQRFSDLDLQERAASYGKAGFALQFQLDTSLADADKYPLKLADLMVMGLDRKAAPVQMAWGSSPDLVQNDLPAQGLQGDRFHAPMFRSRDFAEYSGTVMSIDPSGRGADETAYAVVRILHGNLFLVASGGFKDGYAQQTLEALATIAAEWKVDHVQPESNYGDGMFTELFKPVLYRKHTCSVEELRVSGQKELRICDTLEPILSQHRLVVDPSVIKKDFEDTQDDPQYSLFWQMARMTRDKGALRNEDRLEALAQACGYWVELMAQDQEVQAEAHHEELMQKELDKVLEAANQDAPDRDMWVTIR